MGSSASTSKLTPPEGPAPASPAPRSPTLSLAPQNAGARIAAAVSGLFTSASSVVLPATESSEPSLDYYARTASALLTGFFLGTFLTLCVLSPHRREIANHFT